MNENTSETQEPEQNPKKLQHIAEVLAIMDIIESDQEAGAFLVIYVKAELSKCKSAAEISALLDELNPIMENQNRTQVSATMLKFLQAIRQQIEIVKFFGEAFRRGN